MATFTTNYTLRKPDGTDFIDEGADLNDNWDIVDTEIKNRANEIDAAEARLDTLEAATTIQFGHVVKNTNQTISNATDTVVTFQATSGEEPASFGDHASNRLVIPTTAWYHIECQITYDGNATGSRILELKRNGTTIRWVRVANTGSGVNATATISEIVNLTASDAITINTTQNSGGNLDLVGNQTYYNFLKARRLHD